MDTEAMATINVIVVGLLGIVFKRRQGTIG
jgi:hypothetical protein